MNLPCYQCFLISRSLCSPAQQPPFQLNDATLFYSFARNFCTRYIFFCQNNLESVSHGCIALVHHVLAVPPNDPGSLWGGGSCPDRRSFGKWLIINGYEKFHIWDCCFLTDSPLSTTFLKLDLNLFTKYLLSRGCIVINGLYWIFRVVFCLELESRFLFLEFTWEQLLLSGRAEGQLSWFCSYPSFIEHCTLRSLTFPSLSQSTVH